MAEAGTLSSVRAKVYLVDFRIRSNAKKNVLEKIDALFEASALGNAFAPDELVAVKTHFGTWGSTRQLRPIFIRRIVENIRNRGGNPYVTETCGLGHRGRSFAPDLLRVAAHNGFTAETVGAPIIPGDGLAGIDAVEVPVNGKRLKKAYLASAVVQAHSIISVVHFKAHPGGGIAGALKNMGIGAASKRGKAYAHMSDPFPLYDRDKCTGCGQCVVWCPTGAIELAAKKATFHWEDCVSCLHCSDECKKHNEPPAITLSKQRRAMGTDFVERFVDTFAAVVAKIGADHMGYINFLMEVTPHCDCPGYSDQPIVPDIGILASSDPVAMDKASADLVNAAPGLPNTALSDRGGEDALKPGYDKLKAVSGKDWMVQIRAAEELGLGSSKYELISLDI